MTDNSSLYAQMKQAVLDGNEDEAARLARQALDDGVLPLEAIDQGFVAGIREAGKLWEEGEYFLPELVTSAQAMKAAMALMQPALEGGTSDQVLGKVVIGTVKGDIHDIGKTLVGTLMSANGFEVYDEGADVPVEKFVERAKEIDADLVCASALLTTTMTMQGKLVQAIRDAGLSTKVMVGGAPVTAQWAEQIKADGYADNAVAAVDIAHKLVGHG